VIAFTVMLACDRCGKKAVGRAVVTELRPHVVMHIEPMPGWKLGSKPSGEVLVACPKCPPVLVSQPPPALSTQFEEELTTADTLASIDPEPKK